jgi:AraC-like DNA-binding protein
VSKENLNKEIKPGSVMSDFDYQINPYIRQIKRYTSQGQPIGYIDPDSSFTLITRGGGFFTLEGIRYQIQRGDLLFFPSYFYHHIQPESAIEQLIIHFDPQIVPERLNISIYLHRKYESHQCFLEQDGSPLDYYLSGLPRVISPSAHDFKNLCERFDQLLSRRNEAGQIPQLAGKAFVLDLIDLMETQTASPPERRQFETKQWQQLEKAIRYMHQQYNQRITLAECADKCHLAPTYFSRLFHEYIGQSFQTYLIAIRLEKAKEMILEGEMNFSEISEQCGFANLAHFSRTFKQNEGCSPTSFQKSIHL